MKNKLQNFWYYYKVPVIMILILLAVGVYFLTMNHEPEGDYHIAVVSPRGLTAEQMAKIQNVIEQEGRDQNGDGAVRVKIHLYRFAIGEDGQDRNEIAGLDADLVGKVSGLFFVEDPERFEEATNGIGKAADAMHASDSSLFSGCGFDDLYLLVRTGADEKYSGLLK